MLTRCLQEKGFLSYCMSRGATERRCGTLAIGRVGVERVGAGKALLRIERQGYKCGHEEVLMYAMNVRETLWKIELTRYC